MKLSRRRFLHLASGAAALPAASHTAIAQTYPSRPVTVIVFVPAGGTPDIIARLVGQALSQTARPVVWSSTTDQVAVAILPYRRSRARRPTATRC